MSARVNLLLMGQTEAQPAWPLGAVYSVAASPVSIHELLQQRLDDAPAQAWLWWDSTLGQPSVENVLRCLEKAVDVWHSGLCLGMNGLPRTLDFVAPTWMLNRDASPTIESTSWRVSPRALLVRTEVLRKMGGLHPDFKTLEGAALEMGHRFITRGVLMRHTPSLVEIEIAPGAPHIPFIDELRFVHYRFGRFWSYWTLMRAVLSGHASAMEAARAWREVSRIAPPPTPDPYTTTARPLGGPPRPAHVSVLIPTLDRYPYLHTLLNQLRRQTIKPHEIIVVDQTAPPRRDVSLAAAYDDLPLKVIYQEQPGQCSSRNEGLHAVSGDHILFVDDDDEVAPDLIASHLNCLATFSAAVSSGVADEVGAGPLPDNFKYARASDVFPTNNTMIRREVLHQSGLFDLAYNRGQRADGDLGMRVYLSGAMMILNPRISVLHHHAPVGGLRTHKARVKTYAASRAKLNVRQLTSATEVYLAKRYFSERQVREMLWLQVFGTLSIRGAALKKLLKVLLGLIYMPNTLLQLKKRYQQAMTMTEIYPQIPALGDEAKWLSTPYCD